jgi:hypothetical protein
MAPRLPDADQIASLHLAVTWDLPAPVQRASTHARFFDHAGSSKRSRLRARLYSLPPSRRRQHPGYESLRGSMAGLCAPLPTLRCRPCRRTRTARGRCVSVTEGGGPTARRPLRARRGPQQPPRHSSAQPPTRLPDKKIVPPNVNQASRSKSLDHRRRGRRWRRTDRAVAVQVLAGNWSFADTTPALLRRGRESWRNKHRYPAERARLAPGVDRSVQRALTAAKDRRRAARRSN